MKKILTFSTIALLFFGCGGSSSSKSDNNISVQENNSKNLILKNFSVIDSYVIGATVCDEYNNCYKSDKNGSVKGYFNKNSKYIYSLSGMNDINLNHKEDEEDLNAINMKSYLHSNIITPLTTLIVDGLNIKKLYTISNLKYEDIFYLDPIASSDIFLLKLIEVSSLIIYKNKERMFVNRFNQENNSELPNVDFNHNINYFYSTAATVFNNDNYRKLIFYIRDYNKSKISKNFIYDIEKLKKNLFEKGYVDIPNDNNTNSETFISPKSNLDNTSNLPDFNNNSKEENNNENSNSSGVNSTNTNNSALPSI